MSFGALDDSEITDMDALTRWLDGAGQSNTVTMISDTEYCDSLESWLKCHDCDEHMITMIGAPNSLNDTSERASWKSLLLGQANDKSVKESDRSDNTKKGGTIIIHPTSPTVKSIVLHPARQVFQAVSALETKSQLAIILGLLAVRPHLHAALKMAGRATVLAAMRLLLHLRDMLKRERGRIMRQLAMRLAK